MCLKLNFDIIYYMKKIIYILILLIIFLGFYFIQKSDSKESDFLYNNSSKDLIFVTNPSPNDKISKQFKLLGQAKGFWYFEASFPVEVYDSNNNLIFQTFAKAQGDWMIEDFVPFVSDINIANYQGAVKVVLKRDNPSGDTKNDADLSFKLVVN